MHEFGLLGKKLSHSYSPMIHGMISDYKYELFEVEEDSLEDFILSGDYKGLNVTIPYKKAVIGYLDELSDRARAIMSVNTIVRRPDNSLYGDNTDLYGFEMMVRKLNVETEGRKAIVLGSGGASASVCSVLRELKARVTVISRSGENNYDNLSRNYDAHIIVNTTPVGMHPKVDESPIDLTGFTECEAVLDIIYNPTKTRLLSQAEDLGLKFENGMYMLVAQAVRSAELFTGRSFDTELIDRIYNSMVK